VARAVGGSIFDLQGAFAKCRHVYFKKWATFQTRPTLATSTCIGTRFADNGDGTVTDNLTLLTWEKKTKADATANHSDEDDADNDSTWRTGAPYGGSGTAFTSFLTTLNGGSGLAGANNWRIPKLVELQTLVLDYNCAGSSGNPGCSCSVSPCVD